MKTMMYSWVDFGIVIDAHLCDWGSLRTYQRDKSAACPALRDLGLGGGPGHFGLQQGHEIVLDL